MQLTLSLLDQPAQLNVVSLSNALKPGEAQNNFRFTKNTKLRRAYITEWGWISFVWCMELCKRAKLCTQVLLI